MLQPGESLELVPLELHAAPQTGRKFRLRDPAQELGTFLEVVDRGDVRLDEQRLSRGALRLLKVALKLAGLRLLDRLPEALEDIRHVIDGDRTLDAGDRHRRATIPPRTLDVLGQRSQLLGPERHEPFAGRVRLGRNADQRDEVLGEPALTLVFSGDVRRGIRLLDANAFDALGVLRQIVDAGRQNRRGLRRHAGLPAPPRGP